MRRLPNISLILLLFFLPEAANSDVDFSATQLELNGKIYRLEIADNNQRKTIGLMYRQFLPSNGGMIFVYSRPTTLSIWMKNTLIPLTVLWLDEEARIIDKQALYPCRVRDCPSYGPQHPAQFVIELGLSEFDRFSLGDRLDNVEIWYDEHASKR